MKRKDLQELKTKSLKDLSSRIGQLQKQKITNLLELKMGKLKNVHSIKKIRKEIAQLKTFSALKSFKEAVETGGKKENAAN